MLAASAMVALRVSSLSAQVRRAAVVVIPTPLLALALNDLEFSTVLPGIPLSVPVFDQRHAGLFEIEGPVDASVRVEFALPAALTADHGALLPVRFGPEDGFADFSHGHPPRGLVFDPHGPVISTLGPNGRLFVRMGGTVLPARTQAGGAYRATISMTVYDLGS